MLCSSPDTAGEAPKAPTFESVMYMLSQGCSATSTNPAAIILTIMRSLVQYPTYPAQYSAMQPRAKGKIIPARLPVVALSEMDVIRGKPWTRVQSIRQIAPRSRATKPRMPRLSLLSFGFNSCIDFHPLSLYCVSSYRRSSVPFFVILLYRAPEQIESLDSAFQLDIAKMWISTLRSD